MKLRTKIQCKKRVKLGCSSLPRLAKKLRKSKPVTPVAVAHQPSKKQSAEDAALPKQYKKIMPYNNPSDTVLLVGEGNFSFAVAIVHFGPLVSATCLDSQKVLMEKYPDAKDHTEYLVESGARVIYDVDCTKLASYKPLKNARFNKIVFNFPHAGKGIKDKDRNIASNQKLIAGFFTSAREKVSQKALGDEVDGEIHLTVKSGDPYDLWDVKKIARRCGLMCKTSWKFHPDLYAGYVHRRTIGFDETISETGNEKIMKGVPRTYQFVRFEGQDEEVKKVKKAKKRKVDSDDE